MTTSIRSASLQVRHRCRNVRCGAKLKRSTDNPHHAFCCFGCYTAHYRNRCVVCEAKLPAGPSNRQICRGAECRAELRKFPGSYLYPKTGERPQRSADKTGLKISTKSGRAFRVVAGPEVPEINLQIGLDPELQARLDRAHRGYLEHREKAKRAAARKALIKRRHPPVNIVGGYRFPGAPAIDFSPIDPPPEWATASRWVPTGDGSTIEDIPDFLNRIPAASRPAATNGTGLVPETGPVSQRVAA